VEPGRALLNRALLPWWQAPAGRRRLDLVGAGACRRAWCRGIKPSTPRSSGARSQKSNFLSLTIVHLGVDLQGVTTKATLADALTLALKRNGFVVSRNRQ
jgi:hypothetical protein